MRKPQTNRHRNRIRNATKTKTGVRKKKKATAHPYGGTDRSRKIEGVSVNAFKGIWKSASPQTSNDLFVSENPLDPQDEQEFGWIRGPLAFHFAAVL